MKKLFTLIAAAAMTMSVSAEEYLVAYNVEGQENHGYAISGTTDDDREVTLENGTKIVALSFNNNWGETNENYIKLTADGGFKTGDVITLKGVISNKDSSKRGACKIATSWSDVLYTTEEFVNLSIAPTSDVASYTYTLAADAPELYLSRDGNTRTQLIYISVVRAEGGETPAEGEAFTIEGFGANTWGKSFDEYVTPFEFDYDTKVVTFKNFLGGETTVDVKFELTDPNGNPSMVGAMFNSVPVSGLGEGDQNTGCTIDNFAGSLIIKQNGVNYGKLDNIKFWPGYNSQLEVGVDGEGAAAVKVYNFTFMLGGDYSQWNAETGSWTAVGSEFVKLMKTLPFDQNTSAIENIEVEAADENAPVEYFNIQGMRVENPAAGQLLIRRQGSKVSKVIIR